MYEYLSLLNLIIIIIIIFFYLNNNYTIIFKTNNTKNKTQIHKRPIISSSEDLIF